MSYIVALTGGIGSGKTTVANLFAALNIPIIDADIIAREVVKPNTLALKKIRQHFGQQILHEEGSLNRRQLREIVFQNEQEKRWLNQLLHPLIQQETLKQFSTCQSPYLIWVIPLLIENQLTDLVDRILVIDVSRETQIERTMKRDNADRQLTENILDAQVDRQTRLFYADDVINNEEPLENVAHIVQQLHRRYLTLANEKIHPSSTST